MPAHVDCEHVLSLLRLPTVLNWVQAFGPEPADEVRRRRRVVGKRWFVDEVFLFRAWRGQHLLLHTVGGRTSG
jgi:transposase-like protein